MQRERQTSPTGPNGAADLPSVTIEAYNLEMKSREGFLGDRASKRAFAEIIADWRERLDRVGADPLGDTPAEALTKPKLDKLLADGDPEQAGLVHGAVEEFSNELAAVIRRFMRTQGWAGAERIAIGGGMRASRIGELIIGRTAVLLKSEGCAIDLTPIRHEPDDAGLIGAVHLTPAWTLKGHDALLAVDIGGTNMRAGVVKIGRDPAKFFPKASVWKSKLWKHADRAPTRDEAVDRLVDTLKSLAAQARDEKIGLAPFIGIGCPGVICPNGAIDRGGQNLPGGDWEEGDFNLARRISAALPEIEGEATSVHIHNDAVVQGLSQRPFMTDVAKWGILTIGTGLGNACFVNKSTDSSAD